MLSLTLSSPAVTRRFARAPGRRSRTSLSRDHRRRPGDGQDHARARDPARARGARRRDQPVVHARPELPRPGRCHPAPPRPVPAQPRGRRGPVRLGGLPAVDALTFVEWPAAGSDALPPADVRLALEHRTPRSRDARLTAAAAVERAIAGSRAVAEGITVERREPRARARRARQPRRDRRDPRSGDGDQRLLGGRAGRRRGARRAARRGRRPGAHTASAARSPTRCSRRLGSASPTSTPSSAGSGPAPTPGCASASRRRARLAQAGGPAPRPARRPSPPSRWRWRPRRRPARPSSPCSTASAARSSPACSASRRSRVRRGGGAALPSPRLELALEELTPLAVVRGRRSRRVPRPLARCGRRRRRRPAVRRPAAGGRLARRRRYAHGGDGRPRLARRRPRRRRGLRRRAARLRTRAGRGEVAGAPAARAEGPPASSSPPRGES